MVDKKQQEQARGGARSGSGRRSLYGDKLEKIVAIELNHDQSSAVIRWAKKHKVNVTMLLRESSLIAAGAAKLGVGLEHASAGWAEPRDVSKWPLKFTAKQHAAVSKAAERFGITMREFVLEAVLAHIGRSDLGARAELAAQAKVLDKLEEKLR